MDINQRVIQLIDKVAGSKSAFSQATGISPVILSHISSGRNKVSLSIIVQILEAYPVLNAEYLLSGRGAVFRDHKDTEQFNDIIKQLELLENELEQQFTAGRQKIRALIRKIKSIQH